MMDDVKRPGKIVGGKNKKIYMDLEDIIREHALPFLPAKSLSRFSCVCRDWKLQISTPFFAHNQSLRYCAVLGFVCQTRGELPSFLSVIPKCCGVPDPSLKFLPESVHIRSASNGLLCCQAQSGDKAYYICNPATQQWKKLPKPNANHGFNPAIVLIFEPSLLDFEADYKLVCAFPSADFDDATEFEIYSSKEGSWKVSGEICFAPPPHSRSGVYANGVVYWKSRGLLAYDLLKDRSQLLQSYQPAAGTLGSMNGKLCTAYVCSRSIVVNVLANAHCDTMEMNSNTRMWEEKRRIVLNSGVLGGKVEQAVVAASSNLLLFRNSGKLHVYDLLTKETKELSHPSLCGDMICLPYVNSLVCL